MRFLVPFLLLPGVALAQSGLRAGDDVLTKADMSDLLSGQIVEFYDGSKSRYQTDGRYAYTYTDDGPEWTGTYTLSDDSLVCVAFDNGSARCDRFVKDVDRVVLIIENGTRFPVRNFTVYQN